MISIIIPVYNEGDAILKQLHSLFDEHAVRECVVIDASDARAVEAVQEKLRARFPQAKLAYIAATDMGRASQMNQGAAVSTGKTLLFLHADTRLPPGALQHIKSGIQEGWHWGRFDAGFDNPARIYRLISWMMSWRSRFTGVATGDQAMFMTRSAFDVAGKFDEIALMEDVAMSKKLKMLGWPLCLEASVTTSARRWEEKGVIRTIILMWWLRLAYWLGVSPDRLAQWYRR